MFESLLTTKNFCWCGDSFHPSPAAHRSAAAIRGRFACMSGSGSDMTLMRDRLGLNKLFLAAHESGTVLVANYLIDLVKRGVPFESIYSVPPGQRLELGPTLEVIHVSPDADAEDETDPGDAGLNELARDIREHLECWFGRLAAQFGARKICVCLSGGVDSGVIAALARQYFSDVTAYTYSFVEPGISPSEDAVYAERLAAALRMPFRLVPASSDDLLGALDNALCYGQDWRDFNVHCAMVNDLVARAIRQDTGRDGPNDGPLVLTGDLANELLADYATEQIDGHEYYRVPAVNPVALRHALIRGLDAGDREVGIFGHYGLDVIQPYGLVCDRYMRVPGAFIGEARFKQTLARAMAGDLLPACIFDRPKVRAQIGSSAQPTGILPVLLRHGCDAAWLRRAFCRVFNIEDQAFLRRFIRGGRYRSVNRSVGSRVLINGYIEA
jgi:asparagine synthetase B (glutamine-hydrolysing)